MITKIIENLDLKKELLEGIKDYGYDFSTIDDSLKVSIDRLLNGKVSFFIIKSHLN